MRFLLRNNLAVSYFNKNAVWRKRDLQFLPIFTFKIEDRVVDLYDLESKTATLHISGNNLLAF
jgi:hypothetical protein